MGHIGVMPAPVQWLLLAAVASVFRIASASPLPDPNPNPNPLPSPNPNPAPVPFLPPFNLLTQLLGFGQSSGTLDGSLDAPHKAKKCKCRRSSTVGFFEDDEDEDKEVVDEASSRTFHQKKPRRRRSLVAAMELLTLPTERPTLPMEHLVTRSQRSTRRRRSASHPTTEGNVEVRTMVLHRRTTPTLAATVSSMEASEALGVGDSLLGSILSSTHTGTRRSLRRESVTSFSYKEYLLCCLFSLCDCFYTHDSISSPFLDHVR